MAERAQEARLRQTIRAWRRPRRATGTQTSSRRISCLFEANQRLPEWRLADRSAHRRYHHYYEDLLS